MLLALCLHLSMFLGIRNPNGCVSMITRIAAQAHAAHVRHIEHMRHLEWLRANEVSHSAPVDRGNIGIPYVSGYYSCSGLESIWESAGGNPAYAQLAASVAMAESGGNSGAISPTADYGLWQINVSWGNRATLDPLANASSAVYISQGGTNWTPWTTYTSGAYYGRC